MTIEQLLNCSANQLEGMTDAELEKHFEPFFNVTRPERAVLNSALRRAAKRTGAIGSNEIERKASELARKFGIDLGDDLL